jgi:hypothetical protein
MRIAALIAALALVSSVAACGGELDLSILEDGDTSGLQDGDSTGSLEYSVTTYKVGKQVFLSTHPRATSHLVKKVNLVLAENNILTSMIESVDQEVFSPLTNGQPTTVCPYLTQTNNNNTLSCAYLVDRAVEEALASSAPLRDTIEQDVDQQYRTSLKSMELDYIKHTVHQTLLSGFDVGAVHASDALRKEGVCDQAPTPKASAFDLGLDQGQALLEGTEPEVMPTIPRTQCNTDVIAVTVYGEAKKKVDSFVKDNAICAGLNPSDLAVAVDLAQAEKNRRLGVEEGMRQAYEALRVRLVSTWVCEIPQVSMSHSPLVLDLGNDGIHFTGGRASFDLAATGEAVAVPVLAKGDALLVLDLDANGGVDSGAELFGNASRCGERECVDGVEALAAHDGNRDGKIDREDPVFQRLRLWQDLDGDGQSQPSELGTLPQAGVRSIGLEARLDLAWADDQGNSALRALTFQRENGDNGVAHDVWFSVRHNRLPENPRSVGLLSTLTRRPR